MQADPTGRDASEKVLTGVCDRVAAVAGWLAGSVAPRWEAQLGLLRVAHACDCVRTRLRVCGGVGFLSSRQQLQRLYPVHRAHHGVRPPEPVESEVRQRPA